MQIGRGHNGGNSTKGSYSLIRKLNGGKITEKVKHGVSYTCLDESTSSVFMDIMPGRPTGYQVEIKDIEPIIAAKTDFFSNIILNGYQSKPKITDLFNKLIKNEPDPIKKMNLYIALYLLHFLDRDKVSIKEVKTFADNLTKELKTFDQLIKNLKDSELLKDKLEDSETKIPKKELVTLINSCAPQAGLLHTKLTKLISDLPTKESISSSVIKQFLSDAEFSMDDLETFITSNFSEIKPTDGNSPINQFAIKLRRLHDMQDKSQKLWNKSLTRFRAATEMDIMFNRDFGRYSGKDDHNYKHWIASTLYTWDGNEGFFTKENLLASIERWKSSKTTIKDTKNAFAKSGLIDEKESKELFDKLKENGFINPNNTINIVNLNKSDELDRLLKQFEEGKGNHILKILTRSANTEIVEYDYLKRKISAMNEIEFQTYSNKISTIVGGDTKMSDLGKKTNQLKRKGINEVIALAPPIDKQIPVYSLSDIQAVEKLIKEKSDDTYIAIASRVLGKNNLVTVCELKTFIRLLKDYKNDPNLNYQLFINRYKQINPKIILHTIPETAQALFSKNDGKDYLNYLSFMFGENLLESSYLFSQQFLTSLLDEDQEITGNMVPVILQNLYLEIQRANVFLIYRQEVTLLLKKLNDVTNTLTPEQQLVLSSAIYHAKAQGYLFGGVLFDLHQKGGDFRFSQLKLGLEHNCPNSLVMLMSLISHEPLMSHKPLFSRECSKDQPPWMMIGQTFQLWQMMDQTYNELSKMIQQNLNSKHEWGPHLNHLIMGYNNTNPASREIPSLSDIATLTLTSTIISTLTSDTIDTNKELQKFLLHLAKKAIKILVTTEFKHLFLKELNKTNLDTTALKFIYSLLTMKNSEIFKNHLCDMVWLFLSTDIVKIYQTTSDENLETLLVIIDILCTNLHKKQWKDEDSEYSAPIINNVIALYNTAPFESTNWTTKVLEHTVKQTLLDLFEHLIEIENDMIKKLDRKNKLANLTNIAHSDIGDSSNPIKTDDENSDLCHQLGKAIEKLKAMPKFTYETIRKFLLDEYELESSQYFNSQRHLTTILNNYTPTILDKNAPRDHETLLEIFLRYTTVNNQRFLNHKISELFKTHVTEVPITQTSTPYSLFKKTHKQSSAPPPQGSSAPTKSQGARAGGLPAPNGQVFGPTSAGTGVQTSAGAAAQPQPSSSTSPWGITQIINDHLPIATSSSEEEITIQSPNQLNALKYTTNIKELHLLGSDLSQHKKEIANIALNNPGIAIFIGKDKLDLGGIMPDKHFIYKTDAKSIKDCDTDPSANSITYDCQNKETKMGWDQQTAHFLNAIANKFLNGLIKNPEFTIRIYTNQNIVIINKDTILDMLKQRPLTKLRANILKIALETSKTVDIKPIEEFIAFLTQTNPSQHMLKKSLPETYSAWFISKIAAVLSSDNPIDSTLVWKFHSYPVKKSSDLVNFSFTVLLPEKKEAHSPIFLRLNNATGKVEFLILSKSRRQHHHRHTLQRDLKDYKGEWTPLFPNSMDSQGEGSTHSTNPQSNGAAAQHHHSQQKAIVIGTSPPLGGEGSSTGGSEGSANHSLGNPASDSNLGSNSSTKLQESTIEGSKKRRLGNGKRKESMDDNSTDNEQEIAGGVKKRCTSPNLPLTLAKKIFSELRTVSLEKPTDPFKVITEYPTCKQITQSMDLETTMNELPIGSLVLSSHYMDVNTGKEGFYVSFLGFIDFINGNNFLVYYAPDYWPNGKIKENTVKELYQINGLKRNVNFRAEEIVVIEDPILSLNLVQLLNLNKSSNHKWTTETYKALKKLTSKYVESKQEYQSDEEAGTSSKRKADEVSCVRKKYKFISPYPSNPFDQLDSDWREKLTQINPTLLSTKKTLWETLAINIQRFNKVQKSNIYETLGITDEIISKEDAPNTDEYIKELSQKLFKFYEKQIKDKALSDDNIMTFTQILGINLIICKKESITGCNELDENQKRLPIAVIYDSVKFDDQLYSAPKDVAQLLFRK